MLPNQIPSLIIPIEKGNLLVPNASVAEIVSYQHEKNKNSPDWPDWVVGQITWRFLELPCISFDKIKESITGEPKIPTRVAIFNTVSEAFAPRFYGVAMTGIPRLARVTQEDIVEEDGEVHVLETLRVQVNGESCCIPNLAALESFLAQSNLH